jgi:hypothetical protein
MLQSTDDLEWVASVLLCLVLLTGMHRLLPQDDIAPAHVDATVQTLSSASPKKAEGEVSVLLSDMRLHD